MFGLRPEIDAKLSRRLKYQYSSDASVMVHQY